jgi:hypothetical protein
MADDISGSGREFLRAALLTYVRKPGLNLARISQETGVGVGTLEAFALGEVPKIADDALNRVAKFLFSGEYLPAIDKLRSLYRPETIPLGAPRPPFIPKTAVGKWLAGMHAAGKAEREAAAPKPPPRSAEPSVSRMPRRPGWIE